MKVTGTQIIVVVDLPIIFAVCTVLYCGTIECFNDLISGFHICVNQWKLAFNSEAFSSAASVLGRLLMLLYFNERWVSMELKNAS